MKKFLIISLFAVIQFSAFNAFGQFAQKAPDSEDGEIWMLTNNPVEFPGGMPALYSYISEKMKCSASKAGTERVMVQFIVDSTGFVRKGSVKFIDSKDINKRPIKSHIRQKCAEQIISIFESSPKWTPGYVTDLDKDVAVRMALPVKFY